LIFATDQGGAKNAFGHSAIFSCGWSAFGARASNPAFHRWIDAVVARVDRVRSRRPGRRGAREQAAIEVLRASDVHAQVAAFTIRPRSCRRSFEETSGD